MHIILGGTGHIGSAVADELARRGEAFTIVTRDPKSATKCIGRGGQVAEVDIMRPGDLRALFRTGQTAFLLNPPADPKGDTDATELASVAAILEALDGSGLEYVVGESTYGARDVEACGDFNTLYALETGLAAQEIPFDIVRGAYYFSNWDMAFDSARKDGVVQSMFPADFTLPMVAPADLGNVVARLLVERPGLRQPIHVEGPRAYSAQDVADAFAAAIRRDVRVESVSRDGIGAAFKAIGFSDKAARSYERMTLSVLDRDVAPPPNPERGATTLQDYVAALVGKAVQMAD